MVTYTQNRYPHKGFTLIELMITVLISGILLTVGIPSFNQSITNSRLTTNINNLISSLNLARSEAIKRGLAVTIRKSGSQWETGWTIFVDQNGDGDQDTGDTLLKKYSAMHDNFTLRGTPSYTNRITYRASGISANGSFVLCDNSDSNNIPESGSSKLIIINNVGRVRMGMDSDNNGIQEKNDGTEIISCINSPFT